MNSDVICWKQEMYGVQKSDTQKCCEGWRTASLMIADCHALKSQTAKWEQGSSETNFLWGYLGSQTISFSVSEAFLRKQPQYILYRDCTMWKPLKIAPLIHIFSFARLVPSICSIHRHSPALMEETHKFLICCSFLEIYNEAHWQ